MSSHGKAAQYVGSTITAIFNLSVNYRLRPGLNSDQASAFIAHKLEDAVGDIQKTLEHLRFDK